MAQPLLTTASTLQCPHGGSVAVASANTRAKAGAPLALASDVFTIAGCPFQIPVGVGTVPHPCLTVQWITVNLRTTVGGQPTLAQDSVGLCLAGDQVPQGPVSVVAVQPRASGS
ncbi:hypothetical protein [Novosphingobium sp.]|jgi:hypothetical protein|uniref:hypothetical protein n=1 Tax=Novosphingobium sp. TaxID=1874826 RepID=UPI002603A9DB|nr:hypothetical protein [Novosphingobium sp.]